MTRQNDLKNRIRERMLKTGESYSTAREHILRAAAAPEDPETGKFFGERVEEMRATRRAWQPGPDLDFSSWHALPEVPLERGKKEPTRAHLVVDIGVVEGPAEEALVLNILSKRDLDGGTYGNVLLGMVTIVDDAGRRTVHRLPPPLGKWVAGQIGLTRQGHNQFPAYLGFCAPRPGQWGVTFMPPAEPAPAQRDREQAAIEDWRSLDELKIGTISEPSETGSRYEVLKAEAFFVSRGLCERLDGLVHLDARRVALPTVTVWTLAGAIMYRLPTPLAEWVLLTMSIAASGAKLFPSEVEFSLFARRYTADFTGPILRRF